MTVDVVSVDSEACDLENLGAMADLSGGTVTKVKASELASNFAGILANPILASQVSLSHGAYSCTTVVHGWVGVGGNIEVVSSGALLILVYGQYALLL